MTKLYHIQPHIQSELRVEAREFSDEFLKGEYVIEIEPGVFRIENGFGSTIWRADLYEAKTEALKFYLSQALFLEQQIEKIHNFKG